MSDYRITLPDGTEVEAPSMIDAVHMYWGITEGDSHVCTLSGEEYTLSDFVDAYERKSMSDNYTPAQRATYTDVAEKLAVLERGGSLTESP